MTTIVKPITSFSRIYKISKYFGIVPTYHFEENATARGPTFELYALFQFCTIALAVLLSKYSLIIVQKHYQREVYTNVLIFIELLQHSLLIVLSLGHTFFAFFQYKPKWIQLNKKLHLLDRRFFQNEIWPKQKQTLIYFYLLLFIVIFDVLGTSLNWPSLIFLYYIPQRYNIIQLILILMVAYYMLNAFKERFQYINSLLTNKTKKTLLFDDIGDNFRILHESLELFNEIFGYAFLLAPTVSISILLQYFSPAMIGVIFPRFLGLASYFCYLLFFIFNVMRVSDVLREEHGKIINSCYRILGELDRKSDEWEKLEMLIEKLNAYDVQITAIGFFNVGKRAILGIVSVFATNYIIIYQFMSNKFDI